MGEVEGGGGERDRERAGAEPEPEPDELVGEVAPGYVLFDEALPLVPGFLF